MGESVAKSSLKQLNMKIASPRLQTEETIKDWAQSVQVGATDLIQCLECHQLQHLRLNIRCTIPMTIRNILLQVMNPVLDALDAEVKLVNSKRLANGFLPITLADDHPDEKLFSFFL